MLIWAYSALAACLTAGYGALFTIVGDYRDAYGISESTIGLIIGIGFIAGFAAQLVIAPLGDRGHARTLVLVGVIVNAVGLVMMGFGTTATTIIIGRIVSGLAIGAANPAIRRIVVVSAPGDVGRNLGRLLSADVFGFALGPAISAVVVGPFGLAAPFLVIAAASVVTVALTLGVPVAHDTAEDPGPGQRLAVDLLRHGPFAGAVVLGASAFLMIGAFDALWDVVHVDLGTADWVANLGITLFAVPLVILGPVGGRLAQQIGPFRIASAGLAAASVFMAAYGILPTGMAIFAVAMVHAVTDGLTIAASGVAVALTVPENRQSGAQGVLGAAQALSAGIMAPVTGALYESSGRLTAYATAAVAIAVMAAIGMALATPSWRNRRRGPVDADARAGSTSIEIL